MSKTDPKPETPESLEKRMKHIRRAMLETMANSQKENSELVYLPLKARVEEMETMLKLLYQFQGLLEYVEDMEREFKGWPKMDHKVDMTKVVLVSICMECGGSFDPLVKCCEKPQLRFMEEEVVKRIDSYVTIINYAMKCYPDFLADFRKDIKP